MSHIKYEIRYASHPNDAKLYDTQRLRKEFLVETIFEQDMINMVYTDYDRIIVGGAYPVTKSLSLDAIDPLKATYFLERRELGIINIGGKAKITVDDEVIELDYREALYLGRGTTKVVFESADASKPAKLYFNSAPAHKSYPNKKVTLDDAITVELGDLNSSNARKINKLIVHGVVDTCQLQMGMTEFKEGSVWNTMPAHTHSRRMEAYFYFEVPEDQAVVHFMGQPQETRHIFMHNEQAVISPTWSIHAGAGTAKYTFIWGMGGENLDYGDMDTQQPSDLR
ncbi:5-dehydro-4-deoxy-D-glucuronate isomerase [Saccharicrinis sp. FJH54]|uniref:5-dehydro-4-deoxy-D-glucuronate isomerase n=1 Tax=Saccharicrinis sp. FJH54 TaxID=3344665 RepID=UPI0035D47D3F